MDPKCCREAEIIGTAAPAPSRLAGACMGTTEVAQAVAVPQLPARTQPSSIPTAVTAGTVTW